MIISEEEGKLLLKQISYYMIYSGIIWLLHLLIISITAFFHFLLDHGLGIIENWVFDKGWEVLSIAKVISFYIVLKSINIRSKFRAPFKSQIKEGLYLPRKEFFVVLIFLFAFFCILGRPQKMEFFSWDFVKFMASYTGTFVFFISDIFILGALNKIYPLGKKSKLIGFLIFSTIFVLLYKSTFLSLPGMQNIFLLFFHFLFCLFLNSWERGGWLIAALYTVAIVAPLHALFGLDPLWGDSYSFLKMERNISFSYLIVLFGISGAYLFTRLGVKNS